MDDTNRVSKKEWNRKFGSNNKTAKKNNKKINLKPYKRDNHKNYMDMKKEEI